MKLSGLIRGRWRIFPSLTGREEAVRTISQSSARLAIGDFSKYYYSICSLYVASDVFVCPKDTTKRHKYMYMFINFRLSLYVIDLSPLPLSLSIYLYIFIDLLASSAKPRCQASTAS